MYKKRSYPQMVFAAMAMAVLILDSKTAVSGGIKGIEICLKSIIPSLFPFFVLSSLMLQSIENINMSGKTWICRMLGISGNGMGIFFSGILGGYPVGAKCVADAYRNKQITENEAARMLGFSVNAGPAFIFGVVGSMLGSPLAACCLWLIQIISAFLTAILLPRDRHQISAPTLQPALKKQDTILSACKAMAAVCSWILLFQILKAFLDRWILFRMSQTQSAAIIGLLEVSSGIFQLPSCNDPELQFILASCMIGFGGLCVFFQAASITKGISKKYYVIGKCIQGVLSFFMARAAAPVLYRKTLSIDSTIILVCIIIVIALFRLQEKNRDRKLIPGDV